MDFYLNEFADLAQGCCVTPDRQSLVKKGYLVQINTERGTRRRGQAITQLSLRENSAST